jgi:hypothetical protein
MAVIEFLTAHQKGGTGNSSNDLLLLGQSLGVLGLSVAVVAVAAAGISRVAITVPGVEARPVDAAVFDVLLAVVAAGLRRTSAAHVMDVFAPDGRWKVAANLLYRKAAVAGICARDEVAVAANLAVVVKVARIALIDHVAAQVATGIVIVVRAVARHYVLPEVVL